MNRRLAIVFSAAAVTVPLAPSAAATTPKKFVGPAIRMQYGWVRVTIFVSGKRMTKVSARAPRHNPESRQINAYAVPILDKEALKTQRVRGVHKVSGASFTSFTFQRSLAKVMAKAGLPGA